MKESIELPGRLLPPRAAPRAALTSWQRSALIVLALMVLPFVLFAGLTLGQQALYFHDIQYYFLPYHQLVVDTILHGWLPSWNPYAFSGIPLLGDGQTAMFYPPNWLFFVLPAALAMNYVVLLQFSIAGGSMFIFGRGLGLGRLAAVLAALAYMFNGYLVSRVVHLSIMSGAALIPLVFWSVDRMRRTPNIRTFGLAAACVMVQALAGHPQVPIYTAAALAMYLLVHEVAAPPGERARRVLWGMVRLLGVYVIGYSLGALQLLPWIDFARQSPRAAAASYELVAGQSLIGRDWMLLLTPYLFGAVQTSPFFQHAPYLPRAIFIWERACYLGILPLALASVAVLSVRRRVDPDARGRQVAIIALAVVALVGVLIAGGRDTFVGHLVYGVPVLGKLRAYARAIILLSFAGTVLAGIGFQQILDASAAGRLQRWLRWRVAVVVAGFAVVFGGLLVVVLSPLRAKFVAGSDEAHLFLFETLQITHPATYVPLLLAAATVALLLWWMRFGAHRRSAWVALGIVAVDMMVYAAFFNPTTSPDALTGTPPSVEFLQRDTSPYRVATFLNDEQLDPVTARAQLAMSWSMVYGISSINGFNSLQPRRYTDVLFGRDVEDVSYGFLGDNRLLQPDSNTLSMLNTKYVLLQPGVGVTPGPDYVRVYGDPRVTIYRNTRVYPRAYFVSEVHANNDRDKAYSILIAPSFDPRTEAVVEADLDPALVERLSQPVPGVASAAGKVDRRHGTDDPAEVKGGGVPPGKVDFKTITPDHIRMQVSTEQERFMVVSEMYGPGWQARIDGDLTPIYRANYLLRGVVVPAGEHVVDMVYRPLWAAFGIYLTLMTFVTLMAAIVVVQGLRRSRGGTPGPRAGGQQRPKGAVTPDRQTGGPNGLADTIALVVCVALYLALIYSPAREYFNSTGDVTLYQRYAQQLLGTPSVFPREYPPLSAALFVLPYLLAPNHYMLAFGTMAAVATAAMVLLVERMSGRGWWLLLYLVLGAFGTLFFRYDIFVVLVTVLAFAAAGRRRWVLAQALLALGVALKLYPLILMPLVVLWQWREERRLPLKAAVGGAVALALALVSMLLLAPTEVMGMLRYHGQRPLEFEATGASIAWLLGSTTAQFSYGSWNVISPWSSVLITLSTVLNVALLLGVYALAWRGRLAPAVAWALALLSMLVSSKVFSTQYLLWVLPFAVLAGSGPILNTAAYRWMWAGLAAFTSVIYPIGLERYATPIMVQHHTPGWMMTLVTARNGLLIVAGILMVIAYLRAPRSGSPMVLRPDLP